MVPLFVLLIAPILILILLRMQQKIVEFRYKIPPGPLRIPGLGCLLQVMLADRSQPAVAFQKLSRSNGNVFSIQLGTVFGVVVNGYDDVREAQANEDIIDRSNEEWILDRTYGKPLGLLFSSTTFWKETIRYTSRTLRDFGFGKTNTMETLITAEFQEYIDLVFNSKVKAAAMTGEGMEFNYSFNAPFVNVIWSLIAGERFGCEDPKLHELVRVVHAVFVAGKVGGGILGAYPSMSKYAPDWSGFTELHETNLAIRKFFEEKIRGVKEKQVYMKNPQNFLEIFLTCIDSSSPVTKGADDHPQSFYPSQSRRRHSVLEIFKVSEDIFTEENLVSIIYDLFSAGSETTGNVLSFLLVYLIRNPSVQDKVREEIDSVVGRTRNVSADDRAVLKYTEATVLEGLRIANTAPLTPRRTVTATYIGPYVIPGNTMVLVNLYSANMDEKYWDNPLEFRPERFLNEDGEIINAERVVAFGAGKRSCLGESVAKLSIFLALSSLIQKYVFEVDPKHGVPSTDVIVGLSTSPKPFKAKVTLRTDPVPLDDE